ncbi:MAG: NADH dehydrogenase (quinone) subunit D [Proteobacteria bacterium]|nr:NADH dehydrogenase (quinone) subunit D [Pseudomonadota bacterium]
MSEQKKYMTLNMGPQHPATHGVLKVILELEGEVIHRAIPVIGHLHRGVEKLGESKTYIQNIVYTDRLDYTSAMINNLAYCLAVEKLMNIEVPERAKVIRVIMSELSRIAAHLIWLATHALDIGAMTLYFYCFREREKILDMWEMVSGQRLTPSYIRIGGLLADLPEGFMDKLKEFVDTFDAHVDEYDKLLSKNPIWLARTKDIGIISAEDAISWGLTGPALRGSGVKFDYRKAQPYCGYEEYEFDVPVGSKGDNYDRYLVRMEELRQSNRILKQAIKRLPEGPIKAHVPEIVFPDKDLVLKNIEALIHQFKIGCGGFTVPKGEVYASVENAKGELGFYIVSDGSSMPYRFRIKSSCFVNLSALPEIVKGSMIADVVAVIGSIDIVLGEIDR